MNAQLNAVELIKDRLDIVDALSIYAGADFGRKSTNREKLSIRCPFHSDSSPSMSVYLRSNKFKCWVGCNDGRHGDVIDVVRLGHNLSMADAIKRLRSDLNIGSGVSDPETTARIIEKRRVLELVKADRETWEWTLDALTWLYYEIPKQTKLINTMEELEEWSPLIRVHTSVEYHLDILLGLEDAQEWERVEIITWTKTLMEGVRKFVEARQHR